MIFRDVEGAYKAVKSGVKLPELNVGAVQNNKERKSVLQGVSLSSDEYNKLVEIENSGVNVYLQPIPENDPVGLKSVEKKFK